MSKALGVLAIGIGTMLIMGCDTRHVVDHQDDPKADQVAGGLQTVEAEQKKIDSQMDGGKGKDITPSGTEEMKDSMVEKPDRSDDGSDLRPQSPNFFEVQAPDRQTESPDLEVQAAEVDVPKFQIEPEVPEFQPEVPAFQPKAPEPDAMASKRLVKEIDALYADINTKQQQIQNLQEPLQSQATKVHEQLYRSKARLEVIGNKIASEETNIKRATQKLAELEEFIAQAKASENNSVKIGSKAYTVEELTGIAEDITQMYERVKTRRDFYLKHTTLMNEVVAWTTQKSEATTNLLNELDRKIEQLDQLPIQSLKADAMKDGVDETLKERLSQLRNDLEQITIDGDFDPDFDPEPLGEGEIEIDPKHFDDMILEEDF